MWNISANQKSSVINDGNPVRSVAFSPNGKFLAIADNVGNVSFWNLASGAELAVLPDMSGSAPSLAFSRSGGVLAIAGPGGEITLLRLDLSDVNSSYFKNLICGEVRSSLTSSQWAQYVPGQPYQKTCPY